LASNHPADEYLKLILVSETKELDMIHLPGQLLQGTPILAVCLVECFS
jgi:hypothetical protein